MKKHTRYLIILAAVFAAWFFILSRPVRIIAGMVHDFGHSIGALIAGFGADSFSGAFAHGNALAGYTALSGFQIAATVFTAAFISFGTAYLLIAASTGRIRKYIAGSAAILILIMTFNYTKDIDITLYSMIYACLVILLFMIDKDFLFKWLMEILGFSMLVFVIFDALVNTLIFELNGLLHFTANWAQPNSDMTLLASATGIPAYVWAIAWLAVSAAVFWGLARMKGSHARKGRHE